MKVTLIPVIEITRWSETIKHPNKGPFWEYAEEYEVYNQACLAAAGFTGKLKAYMKGSDFYRLMEVNDTDLLLQIHQRTEGYEMEEVCPFDSGYVLNMDGRDMLFPQCCGDLSDIQYWENIAEGKNEFWQGHPGPAISFGNDFIIFDVSVGPHDENFVRPPPVTVFEVERQALAKAVAKAKEELVMFAGRLIAINDANNLKIDHIDELLAGIRVG